VRAFIARVRKQPFRTSPQHIDFNPLRRATGVLAKDGKLRVFMVIEGNMPWEMEYLLKQDARVLPLKEAIDVASRADNYNWQDLLALREELARTERMIPKRVLKKPMLPKRPKPRRF
jgi:hypothetical protein